MSDDLPRRDPADSTRLRLPGVPRRPGMEHRWEPGALLAIVCLKIVLLVLDSRPQLYLGDSASYLVTAMRGWIPLDRSFVYGFLIRGITGIHSTLETVVVVQALAGAVGAWLFVLLARRLGFTPGAAWTVGLLTALLPIQLVYERFLMTETFSGLGFALYLVLSVSYVRRRSLTRLVLLATAAFLLVAFRTSFLPQIMTSCIALPVFAFFAPAGGGRTPRPARYRRFAVHLAVSVLCTFAALQGYRHFYALVSHRPPGYHSTQGRFLLGSVASIVEPGDVADPKIRAVLFAPGGVELHNPSKRPQQLFSRNGFIPRLNRAVPDHVLADRIAGDIARHAILAHPGAFLAAGLDNLRRYVDLDIVRRRIRVELGNKPLPSSLVANLAAVYGFEDRPAEARLTFVPRLALHSAYWIAAVAVLAFPLAAVVAIVAWRDRHPAGLVLAGHLAVAMAVNVWLAPIANMRYLHPMEPMILVGVCFALSSLKNRPPAPAVSSSSR